MSQPSGDFALGWKAKFKANWTELKVYYFGDNNLRIILAVGARLGIIKKIVYSISLWSVGNEYNKTKGGGIPDISADEPYHACSVILANF